MHSYGKAAIVLAGVYLLGYGVTMDLLPFMKRNTATWLANKIRL
jgi:hypothetical protein